MSGSTEGVRYAYFILKGNRTVKVPYNGDKLEASRKCVEMYGESGYLDSVENRPHKEGQLV